MDRAFWRSATVLRHYKKPLTLALAGSLVSAACFGAGLGMLLPIFSILLQRGATVQDLIREYLLSEGNPGPVVALGRYLLEIAPAGRFEAFLSVMGVVAVLSVVGTVGRSTHQLVTLTVVQHAAMRWRRMLFRRLVHAPLFDGQATGTQDRVSRLMTDVNLMATGYRALLGPAVQAALHGASAGVVALTINWKLSLLVLVGAPALGVMLRKFGKRIRKATRRELGERGRMMGTLQESLNGLRVVKVHDAEGYERRRFAGVNRSLYRQEMKARTVKAIASPAIELLATLGVMGVASIAAWLIFERGEPAEAFMTSLFALAGAALSLKPLTDLNNILHESGAAAQRVLELTELAVEPRGSHADPAAVALPRHRESIEFDRVVFRYAGEREPALRELSLRVPHGQRVAIVGPNGSGKTTLLSLVPRLITPESGAVRIDGVDLARARLSDLRRQVAVVTQQTVLFEGTVAMNIAYGRRHTPRERIVAAARAAHADAFITQLPEGYDTPLGEHGAGLSGGQAQRLAIARAVLRDPAILILDEATSQIDAESEAEIGKALKEVSRGRTTLVIAHRLSTVVDADLIVVMESGKIVDQGAHGELLSRCRLYQTLTQTQLMSAG